ncbi:MAG: 6-bladed beta-propeller, partial [Prevotellaceae bacterium]|nr:6-bladed beta-propeller [Prevotellaceae bacterium]
MSTQHLKWISCALLCALSACVSRPSDTGEFIVIDTDNATTIEEIKLSEMVDSVRYILIEEPDEALVNFVSHIALTDEYIIISDRNAVRCYDKQGRYLRTIARKGEGPGNFSAVSSMEISGDVLYVLDNNHNKVFRYDLNGRFLGDIPVPKQHHAYYADDMAFV